MDDVVDGPSGNHLIYAALAAVKKAITAVGKTGYNEQQKFNFRGVDDVVNAVSPALRDNGVTVFPRLEEIEYATLEVGQGDRRRTMAHVRVVVDYTFIASDGSYITARVPAESMDTGDKATAKAMSVAYRIALLQVLTLPTTDRDPDADSYERSDAAAAAHYEDEGNRQAAGPGRRQQRPAAERPAPEPDAAAQAFAAKVLECTTLDALKAIHSQASTAGKLSEPVRRGDTVGGLGQLITWKREQLERSALEKA